MFGNPGMARLTDDSLMKFDRRLICRSQRGVFKETAGHKTAAPRGKPVRSRPLPLRYEHTGGPGRNRCPGRFAKQQSNCCMYRQHDWICDR